VTIKRARNRRVNAGQKEIYTYPASWLIMCGICGFWGLDDKNLLKRMNKSLEHRGPDDEGYIVSMMKKLGTEQVRTYTLGFNEKK